MPFLVICLPTVTLHSQITRMFSMSSSVIFKFFTCRYIPYTLQVYKTLVTILHSAMSLQGIHVSRMAEHLCHFNPRH